MVRAPRSFVPGAVYHVFSRGSNRQAIFVFDSDRVDFLMCLDRVVLNYELRCLAYCLMTNHFHLVVQAPLGGPSLSKGMQELNGGYSRTFTCEDIELTFRVHERFLELVKEAVSVRA